MKAIVYRTSFYNQKVKIGEFNDVYHPIVFLKGLLDRDNDNESDGEYVVEYIHEEKQD